MSWQDRDYSRSSPTMGGGVGGRLAGTSVVTWLLIINFAVFVWDGIFFASQRGHMLALYEHGYFSVEKCFMQFQVWRLFTYQFLHGGLWHLAGNLIGLFFFGRLIEQWLGSKRFLAFYLLCGVSGAVIVTLLSFVPGLLGMSPSTSLIGASGSVFGIIVAAAVLFPHQRVMLLFPPIPMSMRTLALVFLGISAMAVLAGSLNAGGDAAHLGGAGFGFLLIKNPRWLNWADKFSPSAIQAGATKGRWDKKVRRRRNDQAEVDRILDKVRTKGLASLTSKEKKALAQATDRERGRGAEGPRGQ